jgi:hypothetical protein
VIVNSRDFQIEANTDGLFIFRNQSGAILSGRAQVRAHPYSDFCFFTIAEKCLNKTSTDRDSNLCVTFLHTQHARTSIHAFLQWPPPLLLLPSLLLLLLPLRSRDLKNYFDPPDGERPQPCARANACLLAERIGTRDKSDFFCFSNSVNSCWPAGSWKASLPVFDQCPIVHILAGFRADPSV